MPKIVQQQLAKSCYWDEEAQTLWVDCRKWAPEYNILSIPSWEKMMMSTLAIPAYPDDITLLTWSNFSQLAFWRKQIPAWVVESCALFPSHQLTLLHYAGRYPQILELLDHSPLLAWRLVSSSLEESEVVALLSGKRTLIAEQVGWPAKAETVRFLSKLRLRLVNDQISDMVDICILDEQRLCSLQSLPRINSMALTLAAHFPNLIGCRLHQSLAQLPCRPMQCQAMMSLLADAFDLADYLALPEDEMALIGQARYLVEVEQLYRRWAGFQEETLVLNTPLSFLNAGIQVVDTLEACQQLSDAQQHAWVTDWRSIQQGEVKLFAWQAPLDQGSSNKPNKLAVENEGWEGLACFELVACLVEISSQKIVKSRQAGNHLLSAEQLSKIVCAEFMQ